MSEETTDAHQIQARKLMLESVVFPIVVEQGSHVAVQGTGFLYETEANQYLVTARHVTEDWREPGKHFGIPLGGGPKGKPVEVYSLQSGKLVRPPTPEPDVAVFCFRDPDLQNKLRDTRRTFLNRNDLAIGTYWVFELLGWPAALSGPQNGVLHSKPVWLQLKKYQGDDQPARHEVLLGWDQAVESRLPGISGSPVWAMGGRPDPADVWTPSMTYRLAGVQVSVKHGEWIKFIPFKHVLFLIEAFEAQEQP